MKKVIFAIMMLMFSVCMVGCEEVTSVSASTIERMDKNYYINYVYHPDTGIVYIISVDRLSPYISETGNYCRYIDGKIIDLGTGEEISNSLK